MTFLFRVLSTLLLSDLVISVFFLLVAFCDFIILKLKERKNSLQ